MACHYLTMKNADEFYMRLKSRDVDIVLKMVKCVLSAYKRDKDQIDIFDITFKSMDQLTFSIDKSQYKELLGNCMEEYELCAEIKKILEGKKRGRKPKLEVL
jgi:galactitol-specific phosphotransferase system IIB component